MRLLLTGAFKWSSEHLNVLKNEGWEIYFSEREDEQFDTRAFTVDVAVCNWLFVNHSIEKFPNLKCIQLLSAGLDRIPSEYIHDHNIELFNARGVYSVPMAEFAVCGVLQLLKHSREFYDRQKEHSWAKDRNLMELSDKRVCVIGTGSVGAEVGKRFSIFTQEVYGVDLFPSSQLCFKEIFPITELDEQLRASDVVVLTLPLTDQTKGMFDCGRFHKMKTGAIFVNIARGGLVNERALVEALDKVLYGAVVDVFDVEPLPKESSLWDKKNVIITPHNSFVSNRNDERMWDVIHHNLQEFLTKVEAGGIKQGE